MRRNLQKSDELPRPLTDGLFVEFPDLANASRQTLKLRTLDRTPYNDPIFNATKRPFYQPQRDVDRINMTHPSPRASSTPLLLTHTSQRTLSNSRTSLGSGIRVCHTNDPTGRSYALEHQTHCGLCQEQAIDHFHDRESKLRHSEQTTRNKLEDDEFSGRREIFSQYAPEHRNYKGILRVRMDRLRAETFIDEIEQKKTFCIELESKQRTEHQEYSLRIQRAILRCAFRTGHDLLETDELRVRRELQLMAEEDAELAAQRTENRKTLFLLLTEQISNELEVETRRRSAITSQEFRLFTQLRLKEKEVRDKTSWESSRRANEIRTQRSNQLDHDEQRYRETIVEDEHSERQKLRQIYSEDSQKARARLHVQRLLEVENRERWTREMRQISEYREFISSLVHSFLQPQEAFFRSELAHRLFENHCDYLAEMLQELSEHTESEAGPKACSSVTVYVRPIDSMMGSRMEADASSGSAFNVTSDDYHVVACFDSERTSVCEALTLSVWDPLQGSVCRGTITLSVSVIKLLGNGAHQLRLGPQANKDSSEIHSHDLDYLQVEIEGLADSEVKPRPVVQSMGELHQLKMGILQKLAISVPQCSIQLLGCSRLLGGPNKCSVYATICTNDNHTSVEVFRTPIVFETRNPSWDDATCSTCVLEGLCSHDTDAMIEIALWNTEGELGEDDRLGVVQLSSCALFAFGNGHHEWSLAPRWDGKDLPDVTENAPLLGSISVLVQGFPNESGSHVADTCHEVVARHCAESALTAGMRGIKQE